MRATKKGVMRQVITELPNDAHKRLQQYAAAKKTSVNKLVADWIKPLVDLLPAAQ